MLRNTARILAGDATAMQREKPIIFGPSVTLRSLPKSLLDSFEELKIYSMQFKLVLLPKIFFTSLTSKFCLLKSTLINLLNKLAFIVLVLDLLLHKCTLI